MAALVSDEAIATASSAGISFVKEYFYPNLEGNIGALGPIYRESSSLIWNGEEGKGSAAIGALLTKLPPCKHEIDGVSALPVPSNGEGTPSQLSVTVMGRIKFEGSTRDRTFSEVFVLQNDGSTYFISTQVRRVLGE
mmetsp:Transcript_26655/g.68454  ORF Transcript_26655/g.68454 Transcript_26655/m.68454 type:complete len:137 (-) Transcript_26655:867-1277(-)